MAGPVITRRAVIALAGLGSAGLLGGAFLFQALGYPPCAMCLWQRWPHAAAMALGAFGFFWPAAAVILAGAAAAALSGGFGLFHSGVEQGWWDGPATCSAGDVSGLSAADLMDQIMAAPLVRCDEIAWQFLSLSMASWNALLSFCLMALWLFALKAPAR